MADEVDLLEQVLTKTARLIAGVRPEQRGATTPCPGYDVGTLVNHLVGWVRRFAAAATGEASDEDPAAFVAGAQPEVEFREAAERAVGAFRSGATDRELSVMSGALPGSAVVGMMLVEYVAHGWDLATATGQPVPFDDAEADAALGFARSMLKPENRGTAFGPEVEVAHTAGSVERLVAFLGRTP